MFGKTDKFWFLGRIIFYAILILDTIVAVAVPVALAIVGKDGITALYILPGLLGCFILWVFGNLFFSFLLDVKLIRNKLYHEENTNFAGILNDSKNETQKEIKEEEEEDKDNPYNE